METSHTTGTTLVIQSYRREAVPAWIDICLDSARRWARDSRYDYRFVDDRIFTLVPDWYRAKVGARLPIVTDYARLVLIQAALDAGYDQAIWLDADLLVINPDMRLQYDGSCAFGRELWVQQDNRGRMKAKRNVHNAVCAFRQGCPVLPFLRYSVESLIRRVDPEHIAPQMVGPKLLTALHNICGFSLLDNVGALSPELMGDIAVGEGPALTLFRERQELPLQAANLCASLIRADVAETACARLLENSGAVLHRAG